MNLFIPKMNIKNYILITTMVKIWIGPIMERTNMERPLPDMSAMNTDRKSTRLNSSHIEESRMPSSA